jgi:hypothetical protein
MAQHIDTDRFQIAGGGAMDKKEIRWGAEAGNEGVVGIRGRG